MLANRNACIRKEIHVATDLVVLDRIHHAIDIDLVLDDIDLVIHFVQVQIRHVVLLELEINELVQRVVILHLLVRDVVLRAAIRKVVCRNFILILLIRHRHIRIAEMASRAPACDGKEQCRPCTGKDVPPPGAYSSCPDGSSPAPKRPHSSRASRSIRLCRFYSCDGPPLVRKIMKIG